jgi:hypothetical protein
MFQYSVGYSFKQLLIYVLALTFSCATTKIMMAKQSNPRSRKWEFKKNNIILYWCDSYPQMSLFVRWNNNLKNTHFSITW